MTKLRKIHEDKSKLDNHNLRKKREDLEAFKDAEAQELPVAERLEEIARIEMSRWVDDAGLKSKQLENARQDYKVVRQELEAKESNVLAKANKKAIMELRSMVNIALTTVRECQKNLEATLERLLDAEVLLHRAIRLKREQDDLLPLFNLLAGQNDSLPSEIRLDLFLTAITVLVCATFDQKCNLFLGLYDKQGEGFFDAKFLVSTLELFQEALFRLRYTPTPPLREELVNTVQRRFFDLGLDPKRDALTQYESKHFLISMLSRSGDLTKLFGVDEPGATMSTYQRNNLGPVLMLQRGMIGPTICKYKLHRDITKHRAQLSPQQKMAVHERSMSMGVDDPLKPDYTRFIAKPKKKKSNKIDPLYHGHLENIAFVTLRLKTEAATLIQSVFRSFRERRIAELAARKQAFLEAKAQALKEMRNKVVREFRKRESGSGVGKMKWDAQVRMRQAKARAGGQSIARSDIVMVMMEETINKARGEIEDRFEKIEAKEAFKGVQFEKKEYVADEPAKTLDISSLFGVIFKSSVPDDDMLATSIVTPRPQETNEASEETKMSGSPIDNNLHIFATVTRERSQAIVEGNYQLDKHGKGETIMETELRMLMARSEPNPSQYLGRLRAVNVAMTQFKVAGIVAEIPSKRLLVRYVERNSTDMLVRDLTEHFKFTRNSSSIVTTMKAIVSSDMERGLLMNDMQELQNKIEQNIRQLARQDLKVFIAELDEIVQRRVETNEQMTEEIVLDGEISRVESHVLRFRAYSLEMLETIDGLKERFKRVRLSCVEVVLA